MSRPPGCKLKDPAQYLRSEFIRPEDLGLYRDLGYDSFRVLERGAPTPVLVERCGEFDERLRRPNRRSGNDAESNRSFVIVGAGALAFTLAVHGESTKVVISYGPVNQD